MNKLHPIFERIATDFGVSTDPEKAKLPSEWQLGDQVQVIFPNNGKLQGKIVKVAFTEHSEPLYDVEVYFTHWDFNGEPEPGSEDAKKNKTGFFRIHGLRQWFISYTQEEWDKMADKEE
jgi:hypothetical protein